MRGSVKEIFNSTSGGGWGAIPGRKSDSSIAISTGKQRQSISHPDKCGYVYLVPCFLYAAARETADSGNSKAIPALAGRGVGHLWRIGLKLLRRKQ